MDRREKKNLIEELISDGSELSLKAAFCIEDESKQDEEMAKKLIPLERRTMTTMAMTGDSSDPANNVPTELTPWMELPMMKYHVDSNKIITDGLAALGTAVAAVKSVVDAL